MKNEQAAEEDAGKKRESRLREEQQEAIINVCEYEAGRGDK